MGERGMAAHLRDYCAHCTLAGFSYIANRNLHITERALWLSCVVLSAVGSYCLIGQFERGFESNAVTIVYESLPPNEKVRFPSVAVCEQHDKFDIGQRIEDYVAAMEPCGMDCYNYDVETFMAFLVYPYTYNKGAVKSRCAQFEDCTPPCSRCPHDGYRDLLQQFALNCSEYLVRCSMVRRPFDCCRFFRPLVTPFGRCFLLNSLLNNDRGGEHWFDLDIDPLSEEALMEVATTRPTQVVLMNEEDILLQHSALPGITVELAKLGQRKVFQFAMTTIANDESVRDVAPEYRRCRFPDETLDHSAYRAYSFSTCLADCLRRVQLQLCNCSAYSLQPRRLAAVAECDWRGYMCLESHSMVKPDVKVMLSWSGEQQSCGCLPSCTEHDLLLVYESSPEVVRGAADVWLTITMPTVQRTRFRRHSLRTRLDAVVSIGGILGLFLGASLLSGIEFVYFFTVRLWNDRLAERRRGAVPSSH